MSFQLFIGLLALITLAGAAYYIKLFREAEEQALELAKSALAAAEEAKRQKALLAQKAQSPKMTVEQPTDTLATVLQQTMLDLENCYAVAYVDISKRILLGMEARKTLPEDVITLIAAATADMYNAPNMIEVANIFKARKGYDASYNNVNEIIVRGDGSVHILMRALSNTDRVCVFACVETDSNNFGLIWHRARQLMPQIEVAAEAAFLVE